MAIRKEELHPETNSSDVIYPKTSSDQIVDSYKIRNIYISNFYDGGKTANVNSPIGYNTITLKDGDFVLNTSKKWLYYRKDGVVDNINLRKKLYYEHNIIMRLGDGYYNAEIKFTAVNNESGLWNPDDFFSAYPAYTDSPNIIPLGLIKLENDVVIIMFDYATSTLDYININDIDSYNDEVQEI